MRYRQMLTVKQELFLYSTLMFKPLSGVWSQFFVITFPENQIIHSFKPLLDTLCENNNQTNCENTIGHFPQTNYFNLDLIFLRGMSNNHPKLSLISFLKICSYNNLRLTLGFKGMGLDSGQSQATVLTASDPTRLAVQEANPGRPVSTEVDRLT